MRVPELPNPPEFYVKYATTYCMNNHLMVSVSMRERIVDAWMKNSGRLSDLEARLQKAQHT